VCCGVCVCVDVCATPTSAIEESPTPEDFPPLRSPIDRPPESALMQKLNVLTIQHKVLSKLIHLLTLCLRWC
jgi:hypothetical protein